MTDRAARLAAFERLLAATPDLPRKGKANPYSSMNGNMVAFIGKDDTLALRLSKARRAAFLEEHPDSVVVSYNTVMKDYVGVPDSILEDHAALQSLWDEMVANARTLKPKPTTKSKK